jgi:hypothetical protein
MHTFKTVFLLCLFVSASHLISGQSCLPGGITFSSQGQIDKFQQNYPNCSIIEGDVVIDSDHITNFQGLHVLTAIEGDLIAEVNDSIVDFSGLENLIEITGDLHIWGNYSLRSMDGLDNLNSIGGSLILAYHPQLKDLSALEKLTAIGNRLTVVYNDSLQGIAGLDHIAASSIKQLNIYHNPMLSECAVKSVCDYLSTFNADIDIYFNSDHCSSLAEIEKECENLSVIEYKRENSFTIFPNPACEWLNIKIHKNVLPNEVSILNIYGQSIIKTDGYKPIINISNISSGVYLVNCKIGNYNYRQKLVIR